MAVFAEKRGLHEFNDGTGYSDLLEVYLTHEDLEDIEATREKVEQYDGHPLSFHTPWDDGDSREERYEAFRKTDQLVDRFEDSKLVVHHPNHPETWYDDTMEKVDFSNTPYLEHQAMTGFDGIYNSILTQEGAGLTLDTAHLYMGEVSDFRDREVAEHRFLEDFEHLFENYGDQIGIVHLADADLEQARDGTSLGEYDMPTQEVCDILMQYDVDVVVEVMPDDREESWNNLSNTVEIDERLGSVEGRDVA